MVEGPDAPTLLKGLILVFVGPRPWDLPLPHHRSPIHERTLGVPGLMKKLRVYEKSDVELLRTEGTEILEESTCLTYWNNSCVLASY